MGKKLNKSKTYEEVYGAPGISYMQDGVPFNGAGEEVRHEFAMSVDDHGKPEKIDIGVDIIEEEPEEVAPEAPAAPEEPKAPTMKPVRKYPSQMSRKECLEELAEYGITVSDDTRKKACQKMLFVERKKRLGVES